MKSRSERHELLRSLLRDTEATTEEMLGHARATWEGLHGGFDDAGIIDFLNKRFYSTAQGNEDGRVALYWRHAMLPLVRELHATERSDG